MVPRSEFGWRHPPATVVRPGLVVVIPPACNLAASRIFGSEYSRVQALVAQRAVDAANIDILRGPARPVRATLMIWGSVMRVWLLNAGHGCTLVGCVHPCAEAASRDAEHFAQQIERQHRYEAEPHVAALAKKAALALKMPRSTLSGITYLRSCATTTRSDSMTLSPGNACRCAPFVPSFTLAGASHAHPCTRGLCRCYSGRSRLDRLDLELPTGLLSRLCSPSQA